MAANGPGWSGFTDEELRKFKGSGLDSPVRLSSHGHVRAATRIEQKRKPAARRSNLTSSTMSPADNGLSVEQSLSVPKSRIQDAHAVSNTNTLRDSDVNKADAQFTNSQKHTDTEIAVVNPNSRGDVQKKEVEEIDEKEGISRQFTSVENFQQRQKLMEEENKKRKEMLSRAIANRKKKTQIEQAKLTRVQKDLDHLDSLLSVDVCMLRDKIEDASRQYVEAQKRYEKAEKEYIEAKFDLHQKTEIKEGFVEHLYAIIQENEIRKAKKLSELMESLEMELPDDEAPLIPKIEELDKNDLAGHLTLLNNVSHHHIIRKLSSAGSDQTSPQLDKAADESTPTDNHVAEHDGKLKHCSSTDGKDLDAPDLKPIIENNNTTEKCTSDAQTESTTIEAK